ncbi:glycosyltransferase family 4 protein [Gordonia sp. Z-3]|uniref:glycosyltransferase family 4 protein n=1 Tax=Gordonia sp. Z-3 TaxID=3115408 RepID=UPI003FA5C113
MKARFPRARHIVLIHSSGTANLSSASRSFYRRVPWLYRATETAAVGVCDAAVVFSQSGAERLRKRSRNVRFSPTWFDSSQFYPPQKSVIEESHATRRRILWACRVEPAKQPILAIECFARLSPEFHLTVAGDGTLLPLMRERAHALGVSSRVSFRGAVKKAEVGDLMRMHDLLAMSSEFEGFSRSIVEALACGLPVVTTEGGDPNGLVVDSVNGSRYGSPSEFVQAVNRAQLVSSDDCVSSVSKLSAREVVSDVYSA